MNRKRKNKQIFFIGVITILFVISATLIPATADLTITSSLKRNTHSYEISTARAYKLLNSNSLVRTVDIRSLDEFQTQRIYGAISAPLADLHCDTCLHMLLSAYEDTPLILYDQDGARCQAAYDLLQAQGYSQVYTLLGGFDAWMQQGYNVASDQETIMDAMANHLEEPYGDDAVDTGIVIDDDCIITTWDGGNRIDPGCMWAELIESNGAVDTYGIYLNITGPNGDDPVTFTDSSIYFFKRLDQGATDDPGENFPDFEYVLDPDAGLGYPITLPGYDYSVPGEPVHTGFFEKQTISHAHPVTVNPGIKTLVATFTVDHTDDDMYEGPYFTYGYLANFHQGGNPWLNSVAYQDGFNRITPQTIDINRNGVEGDHGDLGVLLSCYYTIGNQVRYVPPADLNNDYMVTITDLAIYLAAVGGYLPDNDDGFDYDPYPDTVTGFQKISDTQGGFTYPLERYSQFSHGIANIGDVDGDGIDDLAVGKPIDNDGVISSGSVFIMFMNQDGTVREHQKISNTKGNFYGNLQFIDHFGWSVEPLGDIDDDGVPDIAVGATNRRHNGDHKGSVFILQLHDDGTIKQYTELLPGMHGLPSNFLDPNDCFGWSIAAIGDLDDNGHIDIVVGAPGDDDGFQGNGAVYTLFLETGTNGAVEVSQYQKISATKGGFDGELLDLGYTGYIAHPAFGCSIGVIGDMNGDGTPEIVVGAFGDDGNNMIDVGSIFILFMNADGTVQSSQKISSHLGGFQATFYQTSWFGYSATGVGDLDNNGVPDVAVGMVLDDDNDDGYDSCNIGAVWLLFLNPDGTVRSYRKISDTQGGLTDVLGPGDHFGTSVELVNDYSGDGVLDLAVGAEFDDDGGDSHGAFYILHLNEDYQ